MHPLRAALLLALTALLIAGCGDDGGSGAPAAPPAQVSTAPTPFVSIDRPGARALVAREQGSRLTVTADVAGRGNPGELVTVTADCEEPGCRTGAQVDAAGRWSVPVLLAAPADAPRVRVVAQSGAQVAIALAELRPRGRRRARSIARSNARTNARTRPVARRRPATAATTPAPATTAPSRMQVVGDSLAVGAQAPLARALPGWTIDTDARTGRPLAEGMQIIRALPAAPVLAVSLFTNDGPGAIAALESAVRETIARRRGGCVIWATIVRPPLGGVSYARANAALERLAAANPGVMRLVPWAREVADHHEWLAADGVHATPAGYAARAQLYANAARGCTTS